MRTSRPAFSLVLLLSLFSLKSLAQASIFTQDDLQAFSTDICDCLEQEALNYPSVEQLLYTGYNSCTQQYLLEHPTLLQQWVKQNYEQTLTGTAQQTAIAEAAGAFFKQGNPVLTKNCSFYRAQFQQFKNNFFQQLVGDLNSSKAEIQAAIDEFESILNDIPNPENLAMVHNLLGILYEFKGDIANARQHYQANIDLNAGDTSLTEVLLILLEEK